VLNISNLKLEEMITCKSNKNEYGCVTEIGGFTIQSDTTADKGGNENGIRPHDILATAFASCLNLSVRIACNKKNISIENVTTRVGLVREDLKTIFTYQIEFDDQISTDTRNEITKMVENCPVRQTLSKPIEFQPF
jgi:putative redox protein